MEEDIKASLVEFVQYDHDTGEKTLVSDMGDTTPPQGDNSLPMQEYVVKRNVEYPTIEEQLDDLYHNGIDGWKANIKAVKDANPKPTGE